LNGTLDVPPVSPNATAFTIPFHIYVEYFATLLVNNCSKLSYARSISQRLGDVGKHLRYTRNTLHHASRLSIVGPSVVIKQVVNSK
jgi:hypothetical protein